MHTAGVTARSALADNHANAASLHAPCAVPHRGADEAAHLLKRLFRGFDVSLALKLWNRVDHFGGVD